MQFFHKILHEYKFDIAANFAAHKHVRSEKDHIAIEAMIENNVFFVDEMLTMLKKHRVSHTFCVSTDKAANPANVMGATKQLMEHIIRSHTREMKITTARFANVAFSNGSLLDGFIYRVSKNQPISAPTDVKRFFVSPKESGQLCVLTCLLGNTGEIFFPKIPESEMMTFSKIAEHYLAVLGKRPRYCDSEHEAKRIVPTESEYPVYFFNTNTSGEKPFEEFFTAEDKVDLNRFSAMGVIASNPMNRDNITTYLDSMRLTLESEQVDKTQIVDLLKSWLKGFEHVETGRTLDDKM